MQAPSTITRALAFATLAFVAADAMAATVRVNCETGRGRAKISVDGKGLAAGSYSTVAVSGGSMTTSTAVAAVAGEIEADYDSNPADIRAGAVAIPATFVNGASVTGKIVDANGNTVIADTVACRVRK
jgi:hypothetical protein